MPPKGRTGRIVGSAREVRPGGTGGKNFRAKNGLLYAEAVTTAGLPKDPAARAKFLNYLRDHNKRLAEELQDAVADKQHQGRINSRRDVATGRLRASILDPRNKRYNAFTYGVGVKSFLDTKSPAMHYWRQIEAGSRVHVGREIMGLWGGSFHGAYGTWFEGARPQYGPYPLADAPYSRHSGSRDGRLMPMSRSTAFEFLKSQGMREDAAKRWTNRIKTTIKNEIEGQHFYREAWDAFGPKAQSTAALIDSLKRTLLI